MKDRIKNIGMTIAEIICMIGTSIYNWTYMMLRRIFGVEHKEYEKIIGDYQGELEEMFKYLTTSKDYDYKKVEEIKKYCMMKLQGTDILDDYNKKIEEVLNVKEERSLFDEYDLDVKFSKKDYVSKFTDFKYDCLEDMEED